MSDNQNFYLCKHCSNLAGLIHNSGVPMYCCEEPMQQLHANTEDASHEKHLPVVSRSGNTIRVAVGKDMHPMTEDHSIPWVYLQTKHGGQRKCMLPNEEACATFAVENDEPVAAFAYCNLHGLWKTEIK